MTALVPSSAVDQISAAMSVCNLRHQVIASNIANRDTQGYQRLQLSFDRAMDRATVTTVPVESSPTSGSQPQVPIEQDLVDLSANAGRYQSMARVLSRYFSILATITASNRG